MCVLCCLTQSDKTILYFEAEQSNTKLKRNVLLLVSEMKFEGNRTDATCPKLYFVHFV